MKIKLLLFLVFFVSKNYSQLSNFNFSVNTTNQTCEGNGAMQFSVSNLQPNSVVTFSVFLLPNQTDPLVITTNLQIPNLSAGNYLVIATQTLNGNSGTQQQQITIQNNYIPLKFSIASQSVQCGNDGKLTINVLTGNAVSYQILSGPVTTSLQNLNVFANLPIGNYSIRVYDICGNAVVNSFTLIEEYLPITLNFANYFESSISCQNLTLFASTNYSQSNIAFPIIVQFEVFPPNNAPSIVYNQTINSFVSGTIQQIIPRFSNQFSFNVSITDRCGTNVSTTQNIVFPNLNATATTLTGCSKKLKLEIINGVAPFTINFLNAPSGFNPNLSFPNHPSPYTISSPIYNNVPAGNYTIVITDACNQSKTINHTVQNQIFSVDLYSFNDGCGTITISSAAEFNVQLQSVFIISAPIAFTNVLPFNISSFIVNTFNNGILFSSVINYSGLPVGNYVFEITDSCGATQLKNLTITSPNSANFSVNQLYSCIENFGSVTGIFNNFNSNSIQNIVITSAPAGFGFTLPYNLILQNGNEFILQNTVAGNYSGKLTTICGTEQLFNFSVIGYTNLNTTLQIQQFCSTFNFEFNHSGNGINPRFAMQIFDEINLVWKHPLNGNQIINNQIGINNFYEIFQNQAILNIALTGKFRIIKATELVDTSLCIKPIKEFEILAKP